MARAYGYDLPQKVIQAIELDMGCRLLYLPPYSPDLNRIEKCRSWLKSRIYHLLPIAENLRTDSIGVLKDATS